MDFIQVLIPVTELWNNPQIELLSRNSRAAGALPEETNENGITTYTKIKNNNITYDELSYDVIAYLVSLGGNVLNYHSYIKLNPTDLIPLGLDEEGNNIEVIRDTYKFDEIGNQIIQTWEDWIHPNNTFTEINGEFYISSSAHYAGFKFSEKPQKYLDGIELTHLRNKGYTILNKEEFKVLLFQNNI